MTSSKPNHFSKAPKPSHWGLRFQCMNREWGDRNMQSIPTSQQANSFSSEDIQDRVVAILHMAGCEGTSS